MNFYRGRNNRQVGSGILSSGLRGVRPIIMSLLAKLKPHAISVGKALGTRALKAAGNVGADLTSNLITGRLNRQSAKDIIKNEAKRVGDDLVQGYKRKLGIQHGSGAKKRRIMPKRKAKSSKRVKSRRGKAGRVSKRKLSPPLRRKKQQQSKRKIKKSINKVKKRKGFKRRQSKDIFSK